MDNQLLLLLLTWPRMDNLTVVWGSWRRRGMRHWDNPVLQVTTDHFVVLSTVYLMCLCKCVCVSQTSPMCKYNYVRQWTIHLNYVCLCVKVITHRIEMHHYPGEHMSRYCRRATQLCHRTHDHWPVATQDAPRILYQLLKRSFLCMPFHIGHKFKCLTGQTDQEPR